MKTIHFTLLCLIAVIAQAADTERFIKTDRSSNVKLTAPSDEESFSFAVFGDRTSGRDSGLPILERAVSEVNTISPDLVMTIGDLVQGYNSGEQWIAQMHDYKKVMSKLEMPWFPVAGNHDIYWRGEEGKRPEGENESKFEENFAPLWYAFEHKNCWFVALFSDEGDEETGEKNFKKPECQQMSEEQMRFLEDILKRAKEAKHVFLFLHHPRWTEDNYGDDWQKVHKLLAQAGNVSACFAGHTHRMKFDGKKDGIEYYTLATTGANVPGDKLSRYDGVFHHFDLITVRGDDFHVAAIPVEEVIDPKANHFSKTLLNELPWTVKSEETRYLEYAVCIPEFNTGKAVLKVGVGHAADNAGDKGVTYKLVTADGAVVKEGFIKSSDFDWISCPASSGAEFTFIISDLDTSFEGKAPGNGGRIKVEMDWFRE
ncbi:MAG: metallophosphoesterase [Phycisphaerae bacterium]